MPKPGGCSNPTCATWSPSPRGTEIGSGACWQGDLGREHFLLERRRHSGEFRVFVDEHGIPPEGAGHDKGISERDSMGSFDIGGDGAERVIGVLPSDVQQLKVGNGLPGEFLTVVIGSDVLDFREADKASDNLSLDPDRLFQQFKHAWSARLCLETVSYTHLTLPTTERV